MGRVRVGVYVDYSNAYSGARDAFRLDSAPGYRGNIRPDYLGKRLALHRPEDGAARRDTHELTFVKVFRGAPDPNRDRKGAVMEARRAYMWERNGCTVLRHTLDYGQGDPVEKGVDVRLATELTFDALESRVDLAVLFSADKDFRHALIRVRDTGKVDLEVGTWLAAPGGRAVGRIELKPERSQEDEIPCHLLRIQDFGKLEDKVDYRSQPDPPNWRGPSLPGGY